MRLLGSDAVLQKLQSGTSGRQILEEARPQLQEFEKLRKKYLIY
jgi:uncharacterized protein YbbC (DUF1343 family)